MCVQARVNFTVGNGNALTLFGLGARGGCVLGCGWRKTDECYTVEEVVVGWHAPTEAVYMCVSQPLHMPLATER